jgi:hypothetical protein
VFEWPWRFEVGLAGMRRHQTVEKRIGLFPEETAQCNTQPTDVGSFCTYHCGSCNVAPAANECEYWYTWADVSHSSNGAVRYIFGYLAYVIIGVCWLPPLLVCLLRVWCKKGQGACIVRSGAPHAEKSGRHHLVHFALKRKGNAPPAFSCEVHLFG